VGCVLKKGRLGAVNCFFVGSICSYCHTLLLFNGVLIMGVVSVACIRAM
jgi:hypothetical protein